MVIDGWLKLTAPAQIAVLFKELRTTIDAVLKELIRKPEVVCYYLNIFPLIFSWGLKFCIQCMEGFLE